MKKEFEEYKKSFAEDYLNEKLDKKELNLSNLSLKNKEDVKILIFVAYGTASRTFKFNKDIDENEKDNKKEELFNNLAERIVDYFLSPIPNNFDNLHKEWCEALILGFNIICSNMTYGKAQKIVNVTFKFLSCFNDYKDKNDYFNNCHLILDSFTLNWYRQMKKENKGTKYNFDKLSFEEDHVKSTTSWSNLDYKDYLAIQKNIKAFFQKTSHKYKYGNEIITLPETPFKSEFIIWPHEMAKDAINYIIKSLNDFKIDLTDLNKYELPVFSESGKNRVQVDYDKIRDNTENILNWIKGELI